MGAEMSKEIPVLFKNKSECCACGACMNVCTKNAISMKEDECGFFYPSVDSERCVGCNMCRKVCAFQNTEETNSPLRTWVAVSKNKDKLRKSASGGAFYTIAESVVKSNGAAAGAAFDRNFDLRHILVNDAAGLAALQGSKYTQSSTGVVFREIRSKLNDGQNVVFSGCPCQVAGLKAYLGKEYDNLLTMYLICHGVPSNKMFKDYIHDVEKKKSIKVKFFFFQG